MISFIKGKKLEIDPTKIIVDVNGIGYELKISLRTYSEIKEHSVVNLFTHLQVKEDSHTLFGFHSKSERSLFKLLISFSIFFPIPDGINLVILSIEECFL